MKKKVARMHHDSIIDGTFLNNNKDVSKITDNEGE